MDRTNYEYAESTGFMEGILHDIKTPMTIMYTLINELEKMPSNGFEVTKILKITKKYWYKTMKMINDATDYGRLGNGLMKPTFKNLDMIYLVREIVNSIKGLSDRKKITLVFNSDVDKCIMAADKYIIERIMLNLLSNSVKFTGESGRIEVNVSTNDGMFVIIVKDDGIGIDADKLSLIFDKYYTEYNELNKNGSGLGLYIVKGLVTLLGGEIYAKSTKGTEITVSIPINIIDESEFESLRYSNFYSDNIVQIELSDDY